MAGSRNDTHYSSGYNLLPTDAAAISLMQMETTGIQLINVSGSPQGVAAANPGSLAFDRTSGNLWKKQSGTGTTVWEEIASGTLADLHTAKFIVGDLANGANFSTIASAIAAASTGNTVFIQTGTYTEDLTLKAGVNLCSFSSDGWTPNNGNVLTNNVIIVGTVTASYSGNCTLSGIVLQGGAATPLQTTGATTLRLTLILCTVYGINGTAVTQNNSTSALNFVQSVIKVTGANKLFDVIAGNGMSYQDCVFQPQTGARINSTSAASTVIFQSCNMSGVEITTTNSQVKVYSCQWGNAGATLLTTAATGNSEIYDTEMHSDIATSIVVGVGTTVTVVNTSVSGGNPVAISGAGTLLYGGLVLIRPLSTLTVTTQTPLVSSNDAYTVTAPGAYPYTTVPQDAVILVDSSAARTIIPLASPTTGQRHIIKDSVGSAAANNITITPSGKNIDGAASSVINVAYGSVTIVYNGSEWSIL